MITKENTRKKDSIISIRSTRISLERKNDFIATKMIHMPCKLRNQKSSSQDKFGPIFTFLRRSHTLLVNFNFSYEQFPFFFLIMKNEKKKEKMLVYNFYTPPFKV